MSFARSASLQTNSPLYKWWVFATIATGTYISVLDNSAVNVALPSIESYFGANLSSVQWVFVGYALAISICLLPMGKLGDIYNRKLVYMGGLVVFITGAALSGTASSLSMLIGSKILQGIGSGMIQGNAMAMILSAFPATERGKVLGLNISVVGAGAVTGPAFGGFIIGALGWRSVFFVSAAAGFVALAVAALVLNTAKFAGARKPGDRVEFDWQGALLSGITLLLFLLVMSNGYRTGWTSPHILLGAAGAVFFLVAFVAWELHSTSPMLEIRLFKRKLIALGVTSGWISFMGIASIIFLIPFYLQKVLGYSPGQTGLILVPNAVSLALSGAISGRLSDRYGYRIFTMLGLTLAATAMFTMAATLSTESSLVQVIPLLMLSSIGMGMFNSPNNSSILSAVERSRYGVVAALTQLTRNAASITSIAISTTIVVATMGSLGFPPSLDAVGGASGSDIAGAFMSGLHRAYFVLGCLMVVGIIISAFKGRVVEPQDAPPAQPGHGELIGADGNRGYPL